MIATSGFLTASECIKFVFGRRRRSAPDATGSGVGYLPLGHLGQAPLLTLKNFCIWQKMQHYRSSILRKIVKIVATRCHLLRLTCTKFNFGWGYSPDPAWRAYRHPSWISGVSLSSKRMEEKGKKERERGNKSPPEWLSQKLGTTANSETALNLIRWFSAK